MKKITTVLFAMLLLTLSVLAVHADQEGNVRWCNIDSDGCYLNEEGGVKSYMYFWTVESCRYFMGNDNPCKNVVPFYTEDKYRHPLEPAPEPIDYHPAINTITEQYTIPVTIIQMLTREQAIQSMFPNGAAEFNGVMIVTGLEELSENGNQRLVSLETAGSGEVLLIPVYLSKEDYNQEEFHANFDDYRPMTAKLSDKGNTALLGGSSGNKSSFLIPYETEGEYAGEMNSNLNNVLANNFQLAGYISSSGVGIFPEEGRSMEAKQMENHGSGDSGSGSNNEQTGSVKSVQFSKTGFNNDANDITLTPDCWEKTGEGMAERLTRLNNLNLGGALIFSSSGTLEVEKNLFRSQPENSVAGKTGHIYKSTVVISPSQKNDFGGTNAIKFSSDIPMPGNAEQGVAFVGKDSNFKEQEIVKGLTVNVGTTSISNFEFVNNTASFLNNIPRPGGYDAQGTEQCNTVVWSGSDNNVFEEAVEKIENDHFSFGALTLGHF